MLWKQLWDSYLNHVDRGQVTVKFGNALVKERTDNVENFARRQLNCERSLRVRLHGVISLLISSYLLPLQLFVFDGGKPRNFAVKLSILSLQPDSKQPRRSRQGILEVAMVA